MVRQKSLKLFLLGCILTVCTTGCAQNKPALTEEQAKKLPTSYSAWVAYWDVENGLKAAGQQKHKLAEIVYFAANFTPQGELIMRPELALAKKALGKGKSVQYLSVVNDVTSGNDTLSLKDTKVVEKLLATPEARAKHIAALLLLAKEQKVAGLEIDYENVWKDEATAKIFPLFVEELYEQTKKANLKLRIVLEPSTPFKDAKLAAGPSYVVMFYNLYGLHSEPGPKANQQFIYNTLAKMETLPQPKSVALANGGCLWSNKDNPRFITEQEAEALKKKHGVASKRDEASQCQVFKYRVGTTVYEVWYADSTTLQQWTTWVKQGNITDISLWRL